jgi:hypothetical protein
LLSVKHDARPQLRRIADGHADIVRELIGGATGLLPGNDNMPRRDQAGWADRWNQVEQAARAAGR